MIGVSKLLSGMPSESDGLRYKDVKRSPRPQIRHKNQMENERPVVVWNMTRACNLNCLHCYAKASSHPQIGEMSTEQAKEMIDDLAEFQVPVLLFSGGEPYLRDDLFELGSYAHQKGIRPVISTNGTLMSREEVEETKKGEFRYIGVSLDGVGASNDEFRGQKGAYDAALTGIRFAKQLGLKTGLRFTITRKNANYLKDVLDLAIAEKLDRVCVYHLSYSGKATEKLDLDLQEKRELIRFYFNWTQKAQKNGHQVETLLVGNYADAPYLYKYLKEQDKSLAEWAYRLLVNNQGDGTGETIACVDAKGDVHPNQFWQHYTLGNVKDRPFSQIWMDTSDQVMKGLKNKRDYIKGRCASCRYFEICQGSSRVRAEAVYQDIWAPDPACYLTDDEIHAHT